MKTAEGILREMTLEEKAGLCSGRNFWHTKAVERLGLRSVMVSDGPHGLRKQAGSGDNLGLGDSVEAVCFPSGAALASSFDEELLSEMGELLAEEARAEHLHTLLGPAINIKRSPLCGRNFEYFSEDPFLTGKLSAAYVRSLQEGGVGASVKHFAANNQEDLRMKIDVKADERTLREIYLAAFEETVKEAQPWTMMCSYNQINGTYSCENPWLLDDILRKEWGFEGIVMTDWGAMNRRVESLEAGCELEMPASYGENDREIVTAVKEDRLSEEVLDRAVLRLLEWLLKGPEQPGPVYQKEAHHQKSREIASRCAVLLKNQQDLLPLTKGTKIALIGGFAEAPRYQGGGSSHINAFRVTSALEAAGDIPNITYAKGFSADEDVLDRDLLLEAVRAAKTSEVAVVFAGLPDAFESEGYDRTHLELPQCQNKVISAVAAAQPNTVVVLHNGSPVAMPWLNQVMAVLELYLGGQAVGEAAIDLLFGDACPGGKLAESFPYRLEDTCCHLDFPGNDREVVYSEGVYVGYRWYDARKIGVMFPFGHGLSYTSFELSDPKLSAKSIRDTDTLEVSVTVKNIGLRTGREVVQLYVSPIGPRKQPRPVKELKGFRSVELAPGESKAITFTLDRRSFAYYETDLRDWCVESGEYGILIGNSSESLPYSLTVRVEGTVQRPFILSDTTTVGEVMAAFPEQEIFGPLLEKMGFMAGETGDLDAGTANMMNAVFAGLPLRRLVSFGVPREEIGRIEEVLRGL